MTDNIDDLLDIKIGANASNKLVEIPEENKEPQHEIFTKIEELKQALLLVHPTMPTLLQNIHRQLKQDPALVTILTEEQISVIIDGLSKHTQVTIAEATKPKKKTASQMTLDDI